MIDKRAIEIALEHGWDDTNHAFATDGAVDTDFCMRVGSWCYDFRTVALDPTFWQSLGNALGKPNRVSLQHLQWWLAAATSFYDLTLTGGDTQAFWDDLLGK